MPKCNCKFVGSNMTMDSSKCEVHSSNKRYGCDICRSCADYKPFHVPEERIDQTADGVWPYCSCGHIAQDHNNIYHK